MYAAEIHQEISELYDANVMNEGKSAWVCDEDVDDMRDRNMRRTVGFHITENNWLFLLMYVMYIKTVNVNF